MAGPPFAGITGGAAAWFNGVVGDIDITPVTTAGGIFTAQTITLWFQMDAWANQWQSLVGQDDNAFRFGRYAATSQIEYGLFNPSSAYFGNETASQISDTNWHHIAAKFNGTNGYIYLDGVLNTNWSVSAIAFSVARAARCKSATTPAGMSAALGREAFPKSPSSTEG